MALREYVVMLHLHDERGKRGPCLGCLRLGKDEARENAAALLLFIELNLN